jgi:ABC-type microcin C transport system duplicated ATPase subunit YejF
MTNLVEVSNFSIRFTGERNLHAVNDLSLTLGEGEMLGLLSESGPSPAKTENYPPIPGSAHCSIWEGATICLG